MTIFEARIRSIIGRAALAAAGIVCSQAAEAALPPVHPYSLRNIQLGITLTQFRQTPHPDAVSRGVTAIVLCSGDPGTSDIQGLALTTTLLQADTKKCGYYVKAPGSEGEQVASVPIAFLGQTVSPLFLFYRPEGAPDYSLAQITFGISNRSGSEVIGLFYRSYGSNAALDVTSVPTTFGTEMSDIRYVWRNDVSSIQLDSLSFVLDQMSVVFAQSPLWSDLSERMATIERVSRIANQEEKRRNEAAERAAQAQKAAGGAGLPGATDAASDGADAGDAASPSGAASASGATASIGGSGNGSAGNGASGTGASANAASGDNAAASASSANSPAAKSPLAGALPPGSPLAGFLPANSPLRSPPPAASSPAASSLAGALPPGSPLAGFLQAAPPPPP